MGVVSKINDPTMLGATLLGVPDHARSNTLGNSFTELRKCANYTHYNLTQLNRLTKLKQSTSQRIMNSNITTDQTLINKEDRTNEQFTTKPQQHFEIGNKT